MIKIMEPRKAAVLVREAHQAGRISGEELLLLERGPEDLTQGEWARACELLLRLGVWEKRLYRGQGS